MIKTDETNTQETQEKISTVLASRQPPAEDSIVRLDNVSKSFGKLTVLNELSINIERTKNTVILGPSGTGKSVLLKHIVGLLHPDSGKVYFNNECMCELPAGQLIEARKQIGFLFQHGALFDSMTVEDNVAFPLKEHTSMSRLQRRKKVKTALGMVGMPEALKKMPAELSGGQQKRVALARAIILEPCLILYDEPTTGLDPIRAGIINELIVALGDKLGATSIVVTHDMTCAKRVSDRIVLLYDGKIICDGTAQTFEQSSDKRVQNFIRGTADEEDLSSIHKALA